MNILLIAAIPYPFWAAGYRKIWRINYGHYVVIYDYLLFLDQKLFFAGRELTSTYKLCLVGHHFLLNWTARSSVDDQLSFIVPDKSLLRCRLRERFIDMQMLMVIAALSWCALLLLPVFIILIWASLVDQRHRRNRYMRKSNNYHKMIVNENLLAKRFFFFESPFQDTGCWRFVHWSVEIKMIINSPDTWCIVWERGRRINGQRAFIGSK